MLAHRTPVAAAVLAAGAILAGSAHAASPSLYLDPLGDSTTAPDISVVALTDNGDGSMSGDVALTGGISGNEIVYVAFDADGNPATGLNGAEYVVVMGLQSSSLARWDGNALTPFKAVPSTFASGTGILHFTFAPADLGSPAAFGFWAGSINGDASDHAPDAGEFSYPPAATPAAADIRSILLGAASYFAKAGSRYTVSVPNIRLGDDTIVTPDSATCTLTWKGKALKPLRTCGWKLPLAVKKKHLILKVTVSYHGTTRTLTLPIVPS